MRYGWGSEEWIHDSRLIIREATEKGMGVSTTSGTNWATANLITIGPDDREAAKKMVYVSVTVAAGQSWSGKPLPCPVRKEDVKKQDFMGAVAIKRLR